MPFHWRDHDERPLEERYVSARFEPDRRVLGLGAWLELIESLGRIGRGMEREPTTFQDELITAFGRFLGAIEATESRSDAIARSRTYPVVFVSHQRDDRVEAEHIAFLACKNGIDYWLDIHDPVLIAANQQIPSSDVRYPIIIAAIIEMALLNSSHLIAVQTKNSMLSKWVPYELGRARDRNIWSRNAGGWFHPKVRPVQFGDYVHLCRITQKEADLNKWLNGWSGGRGPLPWGRGSTTPLPT